MTRATTVTDEQAPTKDGRQETGRAATLVAPRTFRTEDRTFASPGPDEVLLRIEGCGICGSDMPLWQGREWFHYPRPAGAPGHEAWGRVLAVGDAVDTFRPGDAVTGLFGDGFQDRTIAKAARLVPVPQSVAEGRPFLPVEPLGCAVNAFRRADVKPEDKVLVVGIGYIGAALVALAADAGAKVMAISRSPAALALAERLGAEHVAQAGKDVQTDLEAVKAWSGETLCDRTFEATGHQAPLDLASLACRVRGTLVIAGYHQGPPRQIDLETWNWRGLDVINGHERADAAYLEGMRIALEHVRAGTFEPIRDGVRTFPLDRIEEAFACAEERPDGFMKAMVTP